MKIYVMYQRDAEWRKHQLDTELMLYEGHMSPSGSTRLMKVKDLSVLGWVIENSKTIYVLREPMELDNDTVEYEGAEFNIDFIINSSKILFVEPTTNKWRPMDQEESHVPFQYASEEEKEKRMEKMRRHADSIGKPR